MSRRNTFSILFLVAFVLIGVTTASAQTTKWVDQAGGSDANDGNGAGTAYATLQFAIDNSTSGLSDANRSIINVMDGAYETTGQLNTGGFDTAILVDSLDFLTIQAVAGNEPSITPSAAVNRVCLSVQNCMGLTVDNIDCDQTIAQFDGWHVFDHDQLTVKNSTFEGGEDGIDFNTAIDVALIENNVFKNINTGSGDEVLDFSDAMATDVVIQDNQFLNNYRHIRTGSPGVASNMTIRRNTFNGTTSEEGVRLIGAAGVLLENNVFLNNLQQGIYIDSGCSDITIWQNTFFNNDQEGAGNGEIRTKVLTADIVIKNNIINGNGSNPAIETATILANEDWNCVYDTVDPGFTFGANTVTGMDPLFVSTTSGSEDLHLQAGSPALEAAPDLGVTDDNEKSVRPNPALSDPDKGAYEMGASMVPGMTLWVFLAFAAVLLAVLTWRHRRLA